MHRAGHYKGNKLSLPSKRCAACGREMTWRKRWARSWEHVKYCSEACRRKADTPDRGGPRRDGATARGKTRA